MDNQTHYKHKPVAKHSQPVVIRKSAQLSYQHRRRLTAFLKRQPTKIEAAQQLGITRHTIDRILLTGRAHPTTITKIEAIQL